MAGDWLKMRLDLADDPAVIGIAATLDVDEDLVVGKLHRLWAWANRQTTDGNAPSVTKTWIDRYLRVTGFADALEKEGWLEANGRGVVFPKFDKHNSDSAKRRALTAIRVASCKSKRSNAPTVTKTLPEKRREEKKSSSRTSKSVAVSWTEADGWAHITSSHRANWSAAFPAVDIDLGLAKAHAWMIANPAKKKKNWLRFLTNWLSRSQEKGGDLASTGQETAGQEAARIRAGGDRPKENDDG